MKYMDRYAFSATLIEYISTIYVGIINKEDIWVSEIMEP